METGTQHGYTRTKNINNTNKHEENVETSQEETPIIQTRIQNGNGVCQDLDDLLAIMSGRAHVLTGKPKQTNKQINKLTHKHAKHTC